jgi:drug/metabolite transporter (DMT)-like permease
MNRNLITGRVYLAIAIIIFATSNTIIRKLTELGGQHLINGRNPIAFCNVLFVGNVCALFALLLIYGRKWTANNIKKLSVSDWLGLLTVAILSSAIAPALTFSALEQTTVNNVVLIGRIEPALSLALSIFILKEKVNFWVILGAIISFVGVALTIILQSPESEMIGMGSSLMIGIPELMILGSAIALAFSSIISKIKLQKIPLGIFTIFRTTTGTIIFFIVAMHIFGSQHFMDVFSPFLWQWMLVYGIIIVVGGQICWFQGIKNTTASDVSLMSSFSPLAGILVAYFILGETPTMAQYIGGIVIILGIILSQVGLIKKSPQAQSNLLEQEIKTGFKGV